MSDDRFDAIDALDALRRVDPLAGNGEEPPDKGSARYDSILERAMATTDTDDVTTTTATPTSHPASASRPTSAAAPMPTARPTRRQPADTGARVPPRRRRVAAAALAVASAILVAGAVTVLRPDSGLSPAAALGRAAEATADVTSLRGTLTEVNPGSQNTTTLEVAGDDMRIETRGTYSDGHVEGSTTVIIGDESTQVALDGSVEYSTIDGDDERLEPFHTASTAVVSAVVDHGEPADLGTETIDRIDATHYRVVPDDAIRRSLADLDPGVLGWFQLGDVDELRSIDIWVADDLIRRVEVASVYSAETTNVPGEHTTRIDLYDFDADIEIEPLAVDPSAPVVGEG